MKLNRTQALFLVGTIAAVGCVVENSDDGGGGDDSEAGAGGSAGSAGSGKGGKGGSSGSAGTNTGGTSGSGGEGGAICLGSESEPQVTCADFMEPGAGGVGAGGEGYGGAGGVGPTCEGMAYTQGLYCADLWTRLKPAVANDARTCMNAQTPEEICTMDFTHGCASEAILAACPDDTADDECETITTDCPEITADECSQILSGMTQAGRDALVACEYCDLVFCAVAASPSGE